MKQTPRHPKVVDTLSDVWGRSVENRRRRLKISQADLAGLCGVKQQTISKIERGVVIPSDNLKVILASKLGTTPAKLFPWPAMKDLVAA